MCHMAPWQMKIALPRTVQTIRNGMPLPGRFALDRSEGELEGVGVAPPRHESLREILKAVAAAGSLWEASGIWRDPMRISGSLREPPRACESL